MQLIDLQFGDVWRVYVGKIHTRAATLRRMHAVKGSIPQRSETF